jgi:Tfp pilus assembly protein PilE
MKVNPLPSSYHPAAARARARARQRGAVLLEYLIVLAFLGVMAALALDARTTAVKRAYFMRAEELMRPVP